MYKTPVIAIFDIGKTNKKLLLFDREYNVVYQESKKFDEIKDEDDFPCEDVNALTVWVKDVFHRLLTDERFDVKAVNFSAYGASFVYLDENGEVIVPLYNYLKPYPKKLRDQFYTTYGGERAVAQQTASPVLGSLNSGMQLYRIRHEKPKRFESIRYALHLPQYLSYLISSCLNTEITSVGCHTNLWNFELNDYHQWVKQEGLLEKFPPLLDCKKVAARIQKAQSSSPPAPHQTEEGAPHAKSPHSEWGKRREEHFSDAHSIAIGTGMHDSSAALIPYLISSREPFVLLSTGTWCISLNPFNQNPLTDEELANDCLCYLSWEGKPVKASRLFAGYEHDQQVDRLAKHFNKPLDFYLSVCPDEKLLQMTKGIEFNSDVPSPAGEGVPIFIGTDEEEFNSDVPSPEGEGVPIFIGTDEEEFNSDAPSPEGEGVPIFTGRDEEGKSLSAFAKRDLKEFRHYEEAYHQLISDIIVEQTRSTHLVLKGTPVKKIFVDGGFANNAVYLQLLALSFPEIPIYASSVAQASALGAALAIHEEWNPLPVAADLIKMKKYTAVNI